jgi:hypothetical protein
LGRSKELVILLVNRFPLFHCKYDDVDGIHVRRSLFRQHNNTGHSSSWSRAEARPHTNKLTSIALDSRETHDGCKSSVLTHRCFPVDTPAPQVDVFYLYTYGTGLWLTAQALPLVVTPKLIVLVLAEESHYVSGKSATVAKKRAEVL